MSSNDSTDPYRRLQRRYDITLAAVSVLAVTMFAAFAFTPAASAEGKRSNMRLDGPRAFTKAQSLVTNLGRAAFANRSWIVDCDRLSTRRIACRYTLSFSGQIPDCDDTITLTTRRDRGERYIGWKIGRSPLNCSAELDVPAVDIA